MIVELRRPEEPVKGEIHIGGSKSESNRLLIIQHLCHNNFEIKNLSGSADTMALKEILEFKTQNMYAGDGGTTSRFILPLLCITKGEQRLEGSSQLNSRPIKPLVDALRQLGAVIEYENKEGELPILIRSDSLQSGKVKLSGSKSSQFITALMLISPYLENGLEILIDSDPVSVSYIELTSDLMIKFGIEVQWKGNSIKVPAGEYRSSHSEYFAGGDWSSASFFIALCSVLDKSKITLRGLNMSSKQGDKLILSLMQRCWLSLHQLDKHSFEIHNRNDRCSEEWNIDLRSTPDLFPPLASVFALKASNVTFHGLSHLIYKESDRYQAVKEELKKINCDLERDHEKIFLTTKESDDPEDLNFYSHQDHRIAMACSLLAAKYRSVTIRNAEVVAKSNPDFWEQMRSLGFGVVFN